MHAAHCRVGADFTACGFVPFPSHHRASSVICICVSWKSYHVGRFRSQRNVFRFFVRDPTGNWRLLNGPMDIYMVCRATKLISIAEVPRYIDTIRRFPPDVSILFGSTASHRIRAEYQVGASGEGRDGRILHSTRYVVFDSWQALAYVPRLSRHCSTVGRDRGRNDHIGA